MKQGFLTATSKCVTCKRYLSLNESSNSRQNKGIEGQCDACSNFAVRSARKSTNVSAKSEVANSLEASLFSYSPASNPSSSDGSGIVDEDRLFRAAIEKMASTGIYCDAEIIALELSDRQALERWKIRNTNTYKDLNKLNMQVNSAITAYLNTAEVQIYSDMEQFVTSEVNGWRKGASRDAAVPQLTAFADLHIGWLCTYVRVMEHFSFPPTLDVESLPHLEPYDVVRHIVLQCERGELQGPPEHCAPLVYRSLAKALGRHSETANCLGVRINVKIIHKIRKVLASEKRVVAVVCDEYLRKVASDITNSFERMRSSKVKPKSTVVTEAMSPASLLRPVGIQLDELVAEAATVFGGERESGSVGRAAVSLLDMVSCLQRCGSGTACFAFPHVHAPTLTPTPTALYDWVCSVSSSFETVLMGNPQHLSFLGQCMIALIANGFCLQLGDGDGDGKECTLLEGLHRESRTVGAAGVGVEEPLLLARDILRRVKDKFQDEIPHELSDALASRVRYLLSDKQALGELFVLGEGRRGLSSCSLRAVVDAVQVELHNNVSMKYHESHVTFIWPDDSQVKKVKSVIVACSRKSPKRKSGKLKTRYLTEEINTHLKMSDFLSNLFKGDVVQVFYDREQLRLLPTQSATIASFEECNRIIWECLVQLGAPSVQPCADGRDGSFMMIGMKGAAPGSVPFAFLPRSNVQGTATIAASQLSKPTYAGYLMASICCQKLLAYSDIRTEVAQPSTCSSDELEDLLVQTIAKRATSDPFASLVVADMGQRSVLGIFQLVSRAFAETELAVMKQNHLPVFDILGKGSFLQFISEERHSEFFERLLRSLIPTFCDLQCVDKCNSTDPKHTTSDFRDETGGEERVGDAVDEEVLDRVFAAAFEAVRSKFDFAVANGSDEAADPGSFPAPVPRIFNFLSELEAEMLLQLDTRFFPLSSYGCSLIDFLQALSNGNRKLTQPFLDVVQGILSTSGARGASTEEAERGWRVDVSWAVLRACVLQFIRKSDYRGSDFSILCDESCGLLERYLGACFGDRWTCSEATASSAAACIDYLQREGFQTDSATPAPTGTGGLGTCARQPQLQLLAFAPPQFATVAEAPNSIPSTCAFDKESLLLRAVNAIAHVALCSSCRDESLWDDFLSEAFDQCSVVDFIARNSEAVALARSDVSFVVLSSVDCTPVCNSLPTLVELRAALQHQNHRLMCAWLLAGAYDVIDAAALREAWTSLLKDQYTTGAVDHLCIVGRALLTAREAPPSVRYVVMRELLLVVQGVLCISVEDVQHCFVEYANENEDAAAIFRELFLYAKKSDIFSVWLSHSEKFGSSAFFDKSNRSLKIRDMNSMSDVRPASQIDSGRASNDSDDIQASNSAAEGIKTSTTSTLDTSECEEFILQIRASRGYKVNCVSTDSVLEEIVQSALIRLSAELYSKDVHFVLELIQNADDNNYGANTRPTLRIELQRDAFVAYNNEMGFQRENISAICNVNKSTKVGGRGYIGQKGIGFKSVFAVSSAPEIHSNGFHIRFERDVNMILPVWVCETVDRPWPPRTDPLTGEVFETCLHLPLDERARNKFVSLQASVRSICDANLLLFLNKLERMVVIDETSQVLASGSGKVEVDLSKERLAPNWTKTSNLHDESIWLTSSMIIVDPFIKRGDVSVKETELCIAFKFVLSTEAVVVEGDGDSNSLPMLIPDCSAVLPLYAFLPTRKYGFRFILQGDFLLSSAREAIREDNEWNIQLLQYVPGLFVEMVREMARWTTLSLSSSSSTDHAVLECPRISQICSSYRVHISVDHLISWLPRKSLCESRVFSDVVDAIYKELEEVPFLQSSSGHATLSSKLVSCAHMSVDPTWLLPEETMFRDSGLRYLAAHQQLDDELTRQLGIVRFDMPLVLRCMECFADQFKGSTTGMSATNMDTLCRLLLLLHFSAQGHSHIPREHNTTQTARGPHVNKAGTNRNPAVAQLVPSQVTRQSVGRTESAPEMVRLPPLACSALKRMVIWPTTHHNVCSCENQIVFIDFTGNANDKNSSSAMSNRHSLCFDNFRELVIQLDARLFALASSLVPGGGESVRDLLLTNLAPRQGGGFQRLTPALVIRDVILPYYARAKVGAFDDDEVEPPPDSSGDNPQASTRTVAAACLAFLYLSTTSGTHLGAQCLRGDSARAIQASGILMPVLEVSDSSGFRLHNSFVGRLHNRRERMSFPQSTDANPPLPPREVHLGLEIPDSATSVLSELVSTALRQLRWVVVDPLVSAFAFGKSPDEFLELPFKDTKKLRNLLSKEEQVDWKGFLTSLGVVDLFGFYSVATQAQDRESTCATPVCDASVEAPSLFALTAHLLRNCHTIISDLPQQQYEDKYTSKRSYKREQVVLPVFMQHPEEIGYTDDRRVAGALNFIATTVVSSLGAGAGSAHTNPLTSLRDRLKQTVWFPVAVSEFVPLLINGLQVDSSSLFFFTSPRNVVYDQNLVSLPSHGMTRGSLDIAGDRASLRMFSVLGPHCLYSAIDLSEYCGDASNLSLSLGMMCLPTADLMLSHLRWSSRQLWSMACAHQITNMFFTLSNELTKGASTSVHSYPNSNSVALATRSPPVVSTDSAKELSKFFTDNIPFIWIADERVERDDSQEAARVIVKGRHYPLSALIVRDPTQLFEFPGSPIRVFDFHYKPLQKLFVRNYVCLVCQAIEGAFTSRGLSASDGRSPSMVGRQRCFCEHGSSAFFPAHLPGPMRTSAGLMEVCSVLRHLKCEMRGDSESPQRHLQRTASLLSAVSAAIWSCFYPQSGIHPYGVDELRRFKATMVEEALLPAVGGGWVSAPADAKTAESTAERLVVVVDNVDLLKVVEEHACRSCIVMLALDCKAQAQVHCPVNPAPHEYRSEVPPPVTEFSLDDLESRLHQQLDLDPAQFRAAASMKSLTLTTKSQTHAYEGLVRFLGIRVLSSLSECRIEYKLQPSAREDDRLCERAYRQVNELLLGLQALFLQDDAVYSASTASGDLDYALSFKVVVTESVEQVISLNVLGVVCHERMPVNHHIDEGDRLLVLRDGLTPHQLDDACSVLATHFAQRLLQSCTASRTKELMNSWTELSKNILLISSFGKFDNLALERCGLKPLPSNTLPWRLSSPVSEAEFVHARSVGQDECEKSIGDTESLSGRATFQDFMGGSSREKGGPRKQKLANPLRSLSSQVSVAGQTESDESSRVSALVTQARCLAGSALEASATDVPSSSFSSSSTTANSEGLVEVLSSLPDVAVSAQVGVGGGRGEGRGRERVSAADTTRPQDRGLAPQNREGEVNHHCISVPNQGRDKTWDSNRKGLSFLAGNLFRNRGNEYTMVSQSLEMNQSLNDSYAECLHECSMPRPECEEGVSLVGDAALGRAGEYLAFKIIRERIEGENLQLGRTTKRVVWVNADAEKVLPYDIVVEHAGGEGEGAVEYFEVKTRSLRASDSEHHVWHISPHELLFALDPRHRQHFHLLLINLRVDQSSPVLSSVRLVTGLWEAAVRKEVSMLVQYNGDQCRAWTP